MKNKPYHDSPFVVIKEKNEEKWQYRTLIDQLLNLEKVFEQEDYNFIKNKDRTNRFGHKNAKLHEFFFCTDLRYLYFTNPPMQRLTLYDICRRAVAKKNQSIKFATTYECFKALFNGEIETAIAGKVFSLKEMKKYILNTISAGLQNFGVSKEIRNKVISELVTYIFDNLANIEHEFLDFQVPDLPSRILQIKKIAIDIFDRFKIACLFTEFYKQKYGLNVRSMFLNEHTILHILLRHVVPCKINFHKAAPEIENALSKDGIFYLPDFSTKSEGYERIYFNEFIKESILKESIDHLYKLLQDIVNIIDPYPKSTPVIVFLNNELFEIKMFREKINSIFPLNSPYQEMFGLATSVFENIINFNDIAEDELELLKYKYQKST